MTLATVVVSKDNILILRLFLMHYSQYCPLPETWHLATEQKVK